MHKNLKFLIALLLVSGIALMLVTSRGKSTNAVGAEVVPHELQGIDRNTPLESFIGISSNDALTPYYLMSAGADLDWRTALYLMAPQYTPQNLRASNAPSTAPPSSDEFELHSLYEKVRVEMASRISSAKMHPYVTFESPHFNCSVGVDPYDFERHSFVMYLPDAAAYQGKFIGVPIQVVFENAGKTDVRMKSEAIAREISSIASKSGELNCKIYAYINGLRHDGDQPYFRPSQLMLSAELVKVEIFNNGKVPLLTLDAPPFKENFHRSGQSSLN